MAKATTNNGVPEGYKLLGSARRVMECELSGEDKDRINEKMHGLMDRQAEVEAEKKKALDALNGRLADIEAEIGSLHSVWKANTREELIAIFVYRDDRRSPPEIVTVRGDTKEEISRRPMTSKESQQLLQFDHGNEGGTEYVEELDTADESTEFATRQSEHEARIGRLLEKVDLTQIVASTQASESAAEEAAPAKSKAKKAKKAKKAAPAADVPAVEAPAKKASKPRGGKAAGRRPKVSEREREQEAEDGEGTDE